MSKIIIHRANQRGQSNLGWLTSRFSFSFADYYDPTKMGFGMLRVINDDVIAGGTGFGMHPHQNMEIITIPLEGTLEHKDSMGNIDTIVSGEIQVMSAGTGIYHSEYNHNLSQPVKLLQIWVLSKTKDIQPAYSQTKYTLIQNQLQTIVSPNLPHTLHINQNAYFSLYQGIQELDYELFDKSNGVYLFVIEGGVDIQTKQNAQQEIINLSQRDAVGVVDVTNVKISPKTDSKINSKILIMEIPV